MLDPRSKVEPADLGAKESTRGLGAVRRMVLGSVSTKVLRTARGPVLVYAHPHH